MATGRERRAERLNERLRGAQRANVGDDSFNLDIPGLGPVAPPELSPVRQTPNTSAKRKRPESDAPSSVPPAEARALANSSRRSTRSGPKDPYDLPDTSKESVQPVTSIRGSKRRSLENGVNYSVVDSVLQVGSTTRSPPGPPEDPEPDELESLPPHRPPRSPGQALLTKASYEEIEESPAGKPGSGRRRVRISGALPSSTGLQNGPILGDDVPPSSSPLARKARRSDVAASIRSTRTIRGMSIRRSEMDEEDELSPDRPVDARPAVPGGDVSDTQAVDEVEPADDEATEVATDEEPIVAGEIETEEAEEIDEVQAAKVLGRKRPRRSLASGSPLLGGRDTEAVGEEEEEEEEEAPAPKRRRGRPTRSPAVQRQSAPKVKPKPRKPRESGGREGSQPKATAKSRRKSGEDDGPSIEITVQRFVNVKQQIMDEANEDDPLQAENPFANRGVTVVDVLAQVCTEVVDATLGQFQTLESNTEDRGKKKEFRIKMRAIEAYREELQARLLQHVIYLNDWQTLRKRDRRVQKEKLALRDDILRLKAEKEQVALQMDAIRIKHEEDTKGSGQRLDTSSLMHDIDLAVERGRNAPEPSRADMKQAELANLEALISQISEEASSASATGGILSQVREFNAFLERAAVALESR